MKTKEINSVIIGEHSDGCNIKKLVDENPEVVPNPWSVVDMVVLAQCDENGKELTYQELIQKRHAETWLEFPCFGKGCKCVKRVRIKAVTQM